MLSSRCSMLAQSPAANTDDACGPSVRWEPSTAKPPSPPRGNFSIGSHWILGAGSTPAAETSRSVRSRVPSPRTANISPPIPPSLSNRARCASVTTRSLNRLPLSTEPLLWVLLEVSLAVQSGPAAPPRGPDRIPVLLRLCLPPSSRRSMFSSSLCLFSSVDVVLEEVRR